MLDRFFELFVIVLVIFFITLLLMEKVSYIYNINEKYQIIYNQFMDGRVLIKEITEQYTNNICNLTSNNFDPSIMDNLADFPYEIIYENLSNTSQKYIFSNDNITNMQNNYIEFNRVCYYNGSLFLVSVLVQ
jgi:ABC-type dipeptide/oligopeptide/nickel transport system permease component